MVSYNQSSNSLGLKSRNQSFLEKMTSKEKIIGVIGFFFLFSGAAIIFAFILFWIAVSVSEREKNKDKVIIILNQTPKTNLNSLSMQLSKSTKYVDNLLKIMILENGYRIRYNLVNEVVILVDKVKKNQTDVEEVYVEFDPTSSQDNAPQVNNVVEENEPEQISGVVENNDSVRKFASCVQCGSKLPLSAKYCNNCGVRQFK